jgi:hypothetical protein
LPVFVFRPVNVWSWDDDNLLIVDGFFKAAILSVDLIAWADGMRQPATNALSGTTYAGISGELNFALPYVTEGIGIRGSCLCRCWYIV